MLKLSFSINNIQNPFQRHYPRGQIVFSFEQNLIEDTDEIKKKVFCENHQNDPKSMSQYESNCIVLWSKFARKIGKCNADWKKIIILRTVWVKLCCLWFSFLNAFEIENSMSLWWNFLKTLYGQYGSNHISYA